MFSTSSKSKKAMSSIGLKSIGQAVIPIIKKNILYNKKFPLSEMILPFDEEDRGLVDSVYDNALAPTAEELIFAFVPALFFPESIFAFVCFRIVFLLLHIIETDQYGKPVFRKLSVHALFIPILVSAIGIVSRRFDIALMAHIVLNALVTPMINRFSRARFLKAVIFTLKNNKRKLNSY
jgi:hypothetical protein